MKLLGLGHLDSLSGLGEREVKAIRGRRKPFWSLAKLREKFKAILLTSLTLKVRMRTNSEEWQEDFVTLPNNWCKTQRLNPKPPLYTSGTQLICTTKFMEKKIKLLVRVMKSVWKGVLYILI